MFMCMSLNAQYSMLICAADCVCSGSVFPAHLKKSICIYCIRMVGVIWDPKATKFSFCQVSFLPGKPHCNFASALSSPLPRLCAAKGDTQVPWCCTAEETKVTKITKITNPQSKLWDLLSSSTPSFKRNAPDWNIQKEFQTEEWSFNCQQNHISLNYLPFKNFLFSIWTETPKVISSR